MSHIGRLRGRLLAEYLEEQDYKRLILILEDPKRRARYPAEADYYLGEAYRLRAKDDDPDKALAAYRRCVRQNPNFAPAHRALGLYALRHKQPAQAREHLRRYLALAPQARDRDFIESYLKQLDTQP